MDERARRVGENEALFRQVNERLEGVNESFGSVTGQASFVCECGDALCIERIGLTLDEYRRIRSDDTVFAIRPGHEEPRGESVIESNERFSLVRKHRGEPAELAEAES